MGIKIPTVTEGQIVAALLRTIATQLVKCAERLDAEAARNLPKQKRPAKVESAREMMRRKGLL